MKEYTLEEIVARKNMRQEQLRGMLRNIPANAPNPGDNWQTSPTGRIPLWLIAKAYDLTLSVVSLFTRPEPNDLNQIDFEWLAIASFTPYNLHLTPESVGKDEYSVLDGDVDAARIAQRDILRAIHAAGGVDIDANDPLMIEYARVNEQVISVIARTKKTYRDRVTFKHIWDVNSK